MRVGQVAKELNVAEPTVWRWLRGDGLTLDRLDEICLLVGLDLRDLLARGENGQQDRFTLAQERILAADRGLALAFFAILHGAQITELEHGLGLPVDRLNSHLERLKRLGLIETSGRGKIRCRMSRSVQWRRGGPLSISFERTVKPLLLSLDFGSLEALYVSDMVSMSEAGRARVHALFQTLRDDIHMIEQQEQATPIEVREWTGVLMMVRPFDLGELTSEWREIK